MLIRSSLEEARHSHSTTPKLSDRVGPDKERPTLPLTSKFASQFFPSLEFLIQLFARLFRKAYIRVTRLGSALVLIRHCLEEEEEKEGGRRRRRRRRNDKLRWYGNQKPNKIPRVINNARDRHGRVVQAPPPPATII